MKPFNQGLFRYQNQNQNRRGDGAGVSSPPSPRCPCALRLIRSPLSFPRCPCSPRRQGCPSWPSPPPPRLTRSPSSFSRPKKTRKHGLWQGHVTAEPRAGGGPRGLRLGWGDLNEAAPQSGVRLFGYLDAGPVPSTLGDPVPTTPPSALWTHRQLMATCLNPGTPLPPALPSRACALPTLLLRACRAFVPGMSMRPDAIGVFLPRASPRLAVTLSHPAPGLAWPNSRGCPEAWTLQCGPS